MKMKIKADIGLKRILSCETSFIYFIYSHIIILPLYSSVANFLRVKHNLHVELSRSHLCSNFDTR